MNIIRKTVLVLILANNTLTENSNNHDEIIDYIKTKEIIQNCINEIIYLLNVNEFVTRHSKVRLLLLIHTNLNNIVKHKWKEHAKIKTLNIVEPITAPRQIYEFVEEAITAIEVANRNDSKDTNNNSCKIENKSRDFFSDLLNKINKQSIAKEESSEIRLGKPTDAYIRHLDREVHKRRMDDGVRIWQPEDPQNNTRRATGGRPVTIVQYPFIASIHVLGRFACSGSVVSSFFVITAASCLQPGTIYKANQRPILVRIGSELANARGVLQPAIEVIFHPGYDPVSLANNLAMIKLNTIQDPEKRIPVKKIRIDSLPIAQPTEGAAKGVFILGWGDIMETQKRKDLQLTSAFLQLQSLDECIKIYTKQYVTNKNFCAGLVYKGAGACNGDIGSPAIVLGTLVGIVSFGPPPCGTVSDPTVFIKVGHYASWINDVIDEKIPKTALSDRFWLSDQELAKRSSLLQNSHEEVLILRQLVHELDKPENELTGAIEEDPEIEDEMKIIFQFPTTVPPAQHSLINKSIVLVPGLHIPVTTVPPFTTTVPSTVVDIGLPDAIPYDFINQFIPDSDELRHIVHEVLTTNETNFKSKNDYYKNLLTSVETNENFEYESSDGGMSIEVSDERITDDKFGLEIVPKRINVNVKKGKVDTFNTEESSLRSKIRSDDVWSEVKRLTELQKKKGFTPMNKFKLKSNNPMGKRIQSLYLAQLARKIKRIRASDHH